MVQMGDRQGHTAMVESKLLFNEYQRCHILVAMAPNGDLNNIAGGTFMKKVSLFTAAAMFALAATVAFGISAIPAKTVKADGDVQINEDNFPDANFRKWVMDNVDTSSYGTLTQAEISKTKKISIVDGEIDINDISGIEFFTSLESLEIQYTGITSIDVSKNKALKKLDCSDNKLTSLDVGKNTALEELYCDECALSYLNVNGCSSLRILVCSDNKLTELDVSRNRQLNRLQCKDNMINTIWLPKEASDFSTFEYDSGANINVVKEGYISINKTNFPDDEFRAWVKANIHNDKEMLSPTDIESVKEIYLGQEGYSDLKGIEFFSELEKLCCSNNYLTNLDISKNLALTYLDCEDNKIKTLDVSNNRALTFLRCDYNQLTSLDVSKNTELTKLDCSDNPLNEIYVRNNTKLKELYCYNNQLVSLDVSQNTDLEVLSCYDNKLIDLDVSKNTALTVLQCGKNGMMFLDLSLNKELDYLDCKYNDYLKSIFLAKDPNDVSIIYYDEGVELFGPEGDTIPISRANFPDDNFRVWIIWQTFGSDLLLTKDEIASVKEIEL